MAVAFRCDAITLVSATVCYALSTIYATATSVFLKFAARSGPELHRVRAEHDHAAINAVLAAVGNNVRRLLNWLAL